jgi:hypothetical protein
MVLFRLNFFSWGIFLKFFFRKNVEENRRERKEDEEKTKEKKRWESEAKLKTNRKRIKLKK